MSPTSIRHIDRKAGSFKNKIRKQTKVLRLIPIILDNLDNIFQLAEEVGDKGVKSWGLAQLIIKIIYGSAESKEDIPALRGLPEFI